MLRFRIHVDPGEVTMPQDNINVDPPFVAFGCTDDTQPCDTPIRLDAQRDDVVDLNVRCGDRAAHSVPSGASWRHHGPDNASLVSGVADSDHCRSHAA